MTAAHPSAAATFRVALTGDFVSADGAWRYDDLGLERPETLIRPGLARVS